MLGKLGIVPARTDNPLPLGKPSGAVSHGLRNLRNGMDGWVSRMNLATQKGLYPLHRMSVNVNQAGQNRTPVQVHQLSAGTGTTCEQVAIAEREDSAVTDCHCTYDPFRSVHRNDVAISKEKVGILAWLGHGGSEPDGHEHELTCKAVSEFHWPPSRIRCESQKVGGVFTHRMEVSFPLRFCHRCACLLSKYRLSPGSRT